MSYLFMGTNNDKIMILAIKLGALHTNTRGLNYVSHSLANDFVTTNNLLLHLMLEKKYDKALLLLENANIDPYVGVSLMRKFNLFMDNITLDYKKLKQIMMSLKSKGYFFDPNVNYQENDIRSLLLEQREFNLFIDNITLDYEKLKKIMMSLESKGYFFDSNDNYEEEDIRSLLVKQKILNRPYVMPGLAQHLLKNAHRYTNLIGDICKIYPQNKLETFGPFGKSLVIRNYIHQKNTDILPKDLINIVLDYVSDDMETEAKENKKSPQITA